MAILKRIIAEKADAILAADLHTRADTPVCRTDDYIIAQFTKLRFIFNLCQQEGCPLLVAGDIGDKSQWPNWLLEATMSLINQYKINIICIPGQHDLPEHRLDYWRESGCGVLHEARAITMLTEPILYHNIFRLFPFGYGTEIKHLSSRIDQIPIVAMAHQMVIGDKALWPGQKAPRGHKLLRQFPEYDLILTGDNHNPFITEYKGRILVNPGSMMRMTAAQMLHKPRVYKWFANTNKVETVYLPIDKNVVSRIHIENKQEQDGCMEALASCVTSSFEIGPLFEKNLEEYFIANKTKKPVRDKIWRAAE
jgi:DNA repair exonuclease SbcCD nuclease subunit